MTSCRGKVLNSSRCGSQTFGHQNYLESLLIPRSLVLSPRVSDQQGQRIFLFNKLSTMLVLLAWGPHFGRSQGILDSPKISCTICAQVPVCFCLNVLHSFPQKLQVNQTTNQPKPVTLRTFTGTSLAVQWLELHLPMQGVWIQSLVRELRSHIPRGQKTKNCETEAYDNTLNKDFKNGFLFLKEHLLTQNLRKFQEIVKNRGAWLAAVHGVTKSQTQISN